MYYFELQGKCGIALLFSELKQTRIKSFWHIRSILNFSVKIFKKSLLFLFYFTALIISAMWSPPVLRSQFLILPSCSEFSSTDTL